MECNKTFLKISLFIKKLEVKILSILRKLKMVLHQSSVSVLEYRYDRAIYNMAKDDN